MKVICCAGALSARRVVSSPSPSSSSEEKDGGGSAKEERVEDETGERKRGRKRGARNRKKGRNAQGKSVISFCACGYDISNRLEGPFFFFFFSVPSATLTLFLPSSSTLSKKVARLSPELCRRQGRPGGEWGGRWPSRGNGDAN